MLLPANNLESILHQAAADHNAAPAFYEELMQSSVFILGRPENEADGEFQFEENQSLIIQHWERDTDKSPVVPFFTSLQMLKNAIKEEEPYLEVPTHVLFEMTLGVPLVLNPNSDFGMEFEPDDVASLLDTSLMSNREMKLDEETDVLLGQIAEQPEELTDMLSMFFAQNQQVQAAYMGTIEIPADGDGEHLMVGIEGQGNIQSVIDQAIKKLSLVKDMPYDTVDFYILNKDDPDISEYMLTQIEPFYTSAHDMQLH